MRNLYTSPDGSGNGLTPSTPASLADAQVIARTYSASENVTVWLAGGTYDCSESAFALGTADSGTNGFFVRWRLLPEDLEVGNMPIFSGGVQITGWTNNAGVWSASVPTGLNSRQFYVNGQRASRTRFDFNQTNLVGNTGDVYTYTDAAFPDVIVGESDVELVFNQYNDGNMQMRWVQFRLMVASMSKAGSVTTINTNAAYDLLFQHVQAEDDAAFWDHWGKPTYIENVFELLANPGEWYLNTTTDTIYYIPREGETIGAIDAWLPVSEQIITGSGNITNVSIEDIEVEYSTWLDLSVNGTYIGLQYGIYIQPDASYYSWWWNPLQAQVQADAAVSLTKVSNFRLDRFSCRHAGGMGVRFGAGSKDYLYQGGTIEDISGNGLQMGDFGQTINISTTALANKNQRNTARSIKVTKCAAEYHGSVGIQKTTGNYIKVLHCEVYDMPYTGISCGAVPCDDNYSSDHEDAFNKIHHTMQILGDGGANYNQYPCANYICHDNYMYAMGMADSITGTIFLYADNNTNHAEYYNNVCSRGGVTVSDQYWFGNNPTDAPYLSGAYLNVHDNYYETGLPTITNAPPTATFTDNTAISASYSSWPTAAKNIAVASGLERLCLGELLEGTLTVYGWRNGSSDTIELTFPSGVSILWGPYYPYSDTWVAELYGVTVENISGISVGAPTITGIIFDRSGTTHISIWDRTGITPITILSPPYGI